MQQQQMPQIRSSVGAAVHAQMQGDFSQRHVGDFARAFLQEVAAAGTEFWEGLAVGGSTPAPR